MHQQPAPLTFPCMPAPHMLGRRFTVMMMPGRIPDHVYGGTAFLASPTVPSPPQSRGFSLPRGEAPKGKVSCLPSKEGEKNFHLEELKAVSCQKLCVAAGWRHCKAPSQDRFTPCPLAPSARPLLFLMYDLGGRTWQPLVGGKNGHENFRQARFYNFRDKCVCARNRKFATLHQ